MKYSSLRNQLAALRAQLPARKFTIRIEGGLPPDWAPAKPDPPGIDLKAQHRMFAWPETGATTTATPPLGAAEQPAGARPKRA